jgi:general stress protein YciG
LFNIVLFALSLKDVRSQKLNVMPNNKENDQDNRGRNQGGNQSGGRGFAGMDEDQQRDIASKGGKAAHEKGTAHQWTSEEAREAGRKGGESSHGGGRGGNS